MELNAVIHSLPHSINRNELPYSRQAITTNQTSGKAQNESIADSPQNDFYPTDQINLSTKGKERAVNQGLTPDSETSLNSSGGNNPAESTTGTYSQEDEYLSQQDLAQLNDLKKRDAEVRAHEQAHLAAAGQYAMGGASFTYQRGPDGSSYAIGGEVGIDISKESSPETTIAKMRTIKRAALAPANPSGADKRIASQASAAEAQARQELLQVKQDDLLKGESSPNIEGSTPERSTDLPPQVSSPPGSNYGSLKDKLAVYQQMSTIAASPST